VLVELPFHQLRAGGLDRAGLGVVPPAELVVGPGASELDCAEGADQRRVDRAPGDGEVLDGAGGVDAVQGVRRYLARAEEIRLCAVVGQVMLLKGLRPRLDVPWLR
jgi:hypothetical protein